MSFDWTTFVLEVLNFLVLVWILKRFLYRPVLAALDARQARVREETARAKALQEEAAALKGQCEERLANLEGERASARRQLDQEMAQQRSAGLERIRRALADEEAKGRARHAATAASREAQALRQAEDRAYGHVAAMLVRLASPELTASLARLLAEDLAQLPPAQRDALQQAAARLEGTPAEIASAHPLGEDDRKRVAAALAQATERPLPVTVKTDPALVAGLRVAVGECLLHANVADELAFFRRTDGHA
jgi:F-type H+-transporting ATPase subunit b